MPEIHLNDKFRRFQHVFATYCGSSNNRSYVAKIASHPLFVIQQLRFFTAPPLVPFNRPANDFMVICHKNDCNHTNDALLELRARNNGCYSWICWKQNDCRKFIGNILNITNLHGYALYAQRKIFTHKAPWSWFFII